MTVPDERMLFAELEAATRGPVVGVRTRELLGLVYMTGPLWYIVCCLPALVLVVVLVLMAGRVVGVPVLLANGFVARCCPCCLDGPT